MESTSPRKKRARTRDSPDSDVDRKRGRPRVEKQDESAADRRRTQIRMAQRAYRQRKESTLEELRKRVSELSTSLELMNKAFLECRDSLLGSGQSQSQIDVLQNTSAKLDGLVKVARNPDDNYEDISLGATSQRPVLSKSAGNEPEIVRAGKNVNTWMDQTAVTQSVVRHRPSMEVGMGYTMYLPEGEEPPRTVDYFNFDTGSQHIIPDRKSMGSTPSESFSVLRVEPQDQTIPRGLFSVRTYNFQETSFARRLHRACLEGAYELLLDPSRNPDLFDRVFKLSLNGRDHSKLLLAVKKALARGSNEPLYFRDTPLIHVGGAGTHFARQDAFGKPVRKNSYENIGVIGPQALHLLEDAPRDVLPTEVTVEITGYEGEWFDPYDVQGYLEEKGIFIEPSLSFAEADISEAAITPGSMSTLSPADLPNTPPQISGLLRKSIAADTEQVGGLDDLFELDRWDNLEDLGLSKVGYSSAQTGSWMNFPLPSQVSKDSHPPEWPGIGRVDVLRQQSLDSPLTASSLSKSPRPRKKHVVIDVLKLVDSLVTSGICLGRTPGFRRQDVDNALTMATIEFT